jgi:SnoaL-like domain
MEPHPTVALVRSYVERLEARDWAGVSALLQPDVVYRMPQTSEVVRGRGAYLRWNQEYPDGWHLRLAEAYGDDTGGAARLDVTFRDEPVSALVFVRVRDGLLAEVTDFWPTSYEPPADRAHLAEREPG